MIVGVVNHDLEATVRLMVRGAEGQDHEVETIIDTGFSGFLTLPSALIAALQLMWIGQENAILADGSIQSFEVYLIRKNGEQIRLKAYLEGYSPSSFVMPPVYEGPAHPPAHFRHPGRQTAKQWSFFA